MVNLKNEIKAAAIHAEAMRLIELERHQRQLKTERLRALRLAQQLLSTSRGRPSRRTKSRGPDLTGALKSGPA